MPKLSESNSIEVRNLSKDFHLGLRRLSLIKGLLEKSDRGNQVLHALKAISFSVKRGEAFAILGPNASGKTTLLKTIAGIIKPTKGEVIINGHLIAFLQLGLGFQDELTALENIYLYAAFLGMDRKEINDKLSDIIEFSELGDFLKMKLKYFSLGMRARLAFSIIAQAQTDIVMLDELLAVGDIYFQKKCFAVLEGFKREGRTLLFVSQSLDIIKHLCQRAILLDKGQQVMQGEAQAVIERYKSLF